MSFPIGIDRQVACLANRARLEAVPETRAQGHERLCGFWWLLATSPACGTDVEVFFFEWFSCSERVLPSAGFRLVVHARSDDDDHPPDEVVLCEDMGRRPGQRLECHVFNWTGRRHGGYHYDPLVPVPVVAGVVHVGDERIDDPVAVASGASLEAVPEVVGPKPGRVLRHQRAHGW